MKLTQTLDTLKTNKQIKISTKRNPPLSYQTVEIKWFYRISYHWKKHGTRWNAKTTLKFGWFWFCFSSATCWFSITISSLSSCLTVEQDERCALIPVHLDTSIFSLYFIFLHHKGFIIDRKVWCFFVVVVFSPNTVSVSCIFLRSKSVFPFFTLSPPSSCTHLFTLKWRLENVIWQKTGRKTIWLVYRRGDKNEMLIELSNICRGLL